MTYRSVLGAYSKPRALVSVTTPRATNFYHTVSGTGVKLDYGEAVYDPNIPAQILDISNLPSAYVGQDLLTIEIRYSTTPTNSATAGIGFNLHYDSSKLSLIGLVPVFTDGFDNASMADRSETVFGNIDNDDNTDRVVSARWLPTQGGTWPTSSSESIHLATVRFSVAVDRDARGTTDLNFTPYHTDAGYVFRAESYPLEIEHISYDVDGNGHADALTDGLMMLRYAFGLRGEPLWRGAIATDSPLSVVEVEENAAYIAAHLDIDGNDNFDALTDGLLILRYLFGMRGQSLIQGSIASGSIRTTAEEIENYLEQMLPLTAEELAADLAAEQEQEAGETVIRSDARALVDFTYIQNIATYKTILADVSLVKAEPAVKKVTVSVEHTHVAVQALSDFLQIESIVKYASISALTELIDRFAFSRDASDSFAISDESLLRIVKKASDSLGIADVNTLTFNMGKTENFNLAEEATLTAIYERSVANSISVSDADTRLFTKETLDSFGMSELSTLAFDKAVSNTFDIADATVLKPTLNKTEQVSAETVFVTHPQYYNTVSDDIDTLVAVGTFATLSRSFTDSFAIQDISNLDRDVFPGSSFGIGDSLTTSTDFIRIFDHSASIAENAVRGLTTPKTDDFSAATAINMFSSYGVSRDESLSISEESSYAYDATKSDTFSMLDAQDLGLRRTIPTETVSTLTQVSTFASLTKSFSDSFTFIDISSLDRDINLPSSFGIGDTLTTSTIFKRIFNSTYSITELLSMDFSLAAAEDTVSANINFAMFPLYSTTSSDSFGLDDSVITKMFKAADASLFSMTDAVTKRFTIPNQEQMSASEFISPFFGYTRSFSSTVDITDAALVGSNFGSTSSNTFGMADVITTSTVYNRSHDDAFSFEDPFSYKYTTPKEDSFSSDDVVTFIPVYKNIVSNSLGLDDSVFRKLFKSSEVEPVSIAETSSLLFLANKNDSIQTSVNVNTFKVFSRSLTSAISIIDFSDIDKTARPDDSFNFADVLTTSTTYNRPLSHSAPIVEHLAYSLNKSFSDSQQADEVLTVMPVYKEIISNSVSVGDLNTLSISLDKNDAVTIAESNVLSVTKNNTETLGTEVDLASFATYTRSLDSVFAMDDSVSVGNDFGAVKDNNFGMGDSASTSTTYSRPFDHPITIKEDVDKATTKAASSTFTSPEELLLMFIAASSSFSDAFSMGDSSALDLTKIVSDAASIADFSAINPTKGIVDSVAKSETLGLFKAQSRSFTDAITILDELDFSSAFGEFSNFSVVDVPTTKATYVREINNTPVTFSDAHSFEFDINTSDSLSAAAYAVVHSDYSNSQEDSFGMTESSNYTFNMGPESPFTIVEVSSKTVGKEFTDAQSTDEHFSTFKVQTLSRSDGITLADQGASISDNRDKFDSFGVGDSATTTTTFVRPISDSYSFTDQPKLDITRPVDTDTFSTEFDFKPFISYEQGINDSITILDAPEISSAGTKTDSASMSDESNYSFTRFIGTETITPSEFASIFASNKRSFTDTFAMDDTFSIDNTELGKANVFGVSDTPTLTAVYNRDFSSSFSFSDAVDYDLTKNLADSISNSENLSVFKKITLPLSSSFTILDAITSKAFTTGLTKVHLFGVNDTPTLQVSYVRKLGVSGIYSYAQEDSSFGVTDFVRVGGSLRINELQTTSVIVTSLVNYNRPLPADSFTFAETVVTTLTTGSGLASRTVNSGAINSTVIN